MPWRDVLEALAPALAETVQSMIVPGIGTVYMSPQSRSVLRPMIRSSAGDAVHFYGTFYLDTAILHAGTIALSVDVRIETNALNHLVAVVEPSSTVDFQLSASGYFLQLFGIASEADVEAAALAQMHTMIPSMITDLVPPSDRLLPIFKRVYVRPDALEIVHAEGTNDTYYSQLNDSHLCNRPNPSTSVPQTGYMFDLFDPPLAGDPHVFGDTHRP